VGSNPTPTAVMSSRLTPRLDLYTAPGDVREWTNRHAWRACDLVRGPRVRIPSSPPAWGDRGSHERSASEPGAAPISSDWHRDTLGVAVLGGGFGVPCIGNPRHAGPITRLRPPKDRVAPGKQR
jgi:hypothetical protein